ncbi:bZIP transcription factor [Colletotrichum scovillei]|uniref:BZIP transcription factor n=2 Tax=Colletotrichum acutatum species complex TaxID=2707335 RepID=A0A9P7UK75_9PEZI|nr:bZIP transcription factor [Colletotrichum scovillei]KXH62456.1 bZIP transcription factor [Colletotrichum nymphaeae SA-01]KAF4776062.1 bZIP transcription factor [Colletotrichum scovillei]KAG7053410.1 bZIP transcription factor [Colletotrichum scovillei]KAG7071705.1 bZIP transcription factor [Colletotrichum scovillei]KAG7080011.1 bZIP transcription factor [Colletotrichum scovillei]
MTTSNQNVDNIDALLDFSEYDNMSYQSPSLSPAATAKNTFTRPSVSTVATPTMPSASQPLTGPSHQYDLYKQQTGIVPGALASTLAVNEANSHISGYNSGYGMDYLGNGLSPENDMFDFNTSPSQNSTGLDMDMEFDSPPDSQYFFPNTTVNPTAIGGQESPVVPSQQSNVGRLWPGMHSQAALAKAQAQQRQQQQIIQQQQQRQQMGQKQRTKSQQPTDPIVEQKITQLLNSMRAKPAQEGDSPTPLMNLPRCKKDEEDMDEDERLLASEEGKKLSSKERRQLRNKVSARAFRSRRKEYITQLEAEIANKVSENGELRQHNRALQDENKRLQDLTRMLLASPSFSNFLDHLSTNPQPVPQQQQAPAVKVERQAEQRQIPKDINPYANQTQQQQIGMAMLPEQNMDFSMLNIDNDAYNFQPQVFAVLETPDVPVTIDTNVLSGKSSNFVGEQFESDDEKIELPTIEAPKVLAPEVQSQAPATEEVFDDEFENDPEFALYHSAPAPATASPVELDTEALSQPEIFGGVEAEKVLARYELVDASEDEKNACVAMAKVQRIDAALQPVLARLESLFL